MKRLSYFLILSLLSLSLIVSCDKGGIGRIDVILSSDLHGALDTTGAKISSYINLVRAGNARNTVVLDGGDFLDGNNLLYYANFVDTLEDHICSRFYNFLEYDALTLGNHDIELGFRCLDKMHSSLKAPVLCCNIYRKDNAKLVFKPYTIIKRGGLKIAVIGMINPMTMAGISTDTWKSIYSTSMYIAASEWVPKVRKSENPDVVILLAHSGGEKYPENLPDLELLNYLYYVAEQVEGIDLICASHSHNTTLDKVVGPKGREVSIMGVAPHGQQLAHAVIEKSPENGLSTDCEIISTDKVPADEAYLAHFGPFLQKAGEFGKTPLFYIDTTVSALNAAHESTAAAGLLHELYRKIIQSSKAGKVGVDANMVTLFIERPALEKGVVTHNDFHNLLPYEDKLCVVALTGSQLYRLLDYNYTMFHEPNGQRYYVDDIEGFYYYTSRERKFNNFESNILHSYPAHIYIYSSDKYVNEYYPAQVYHVAMNSFRAYNGGNFLSNALGWSNKAIKAHIVWESETSIRSMIMDITNPTDTLRPRALNNWKEID